MSLLLRIYKMKVRKLTPLECIKLMGFDAQDYKKLKDAGISDTQIYKQAGNSIAVNVAEAIFKELEQAQLLELKNE